VNSTFVFALLAAIFFGLSAIPAKRGLSHTDTQTGALISILTVVTVFLISSPWWMRSQDWFTTGFWIFVATGLLHPALSLYFTLESMDRAGATVASTLAATSPIFAALTAMILLGESMTPLIAIGTLVTMCGVISLTWMPGTGITRVMRIALVFATAAAVIRGLINTTGKFGLDLMPNAMMAGFLSHAVGGLGVLVIYRLRRGRLPLNMSGGRISCLRPVGLFHRDSNRLHVFGALAQLGDLSSASHRNLPGIHTARGARLERGKNHATHRGRRRRGGCGGCPDHLDVVTSTTLRRTVIVFSYHHPKYRPE